MQVQALGHVVLKVRSLERSEGFYSGMLGMPIISRLTDPPMTFFSFETTGNHHDFAIMELGSLAPSAAEDTTGLAHVAFKVGSSVQDLGRHVACSRHRERRSSMRWSGDSQGVTNCSIRMVTRLSYTSTSPMPDP